MEIKLVELNVNHKAGNTNHGSKCKELVKQINCILKEKPDIIILTEYHPFENKGATELIDKKSQEMMVFNDKYNVFEYIPDNKSDNGILIALSKEKITSKKIEIKQPNLLVVSAEIGAIEFNIVGIRVPTGIGKDLNDNYKEAFEYFVGLVSKFKEFKNIIGAGDFNNARILGDKSKTFVDVAVQYKGYAQEPYNFHIIKDYLKKNLKGTDFSFITPKKDYSMSNNLSVIDHAFSTNIKNMPISSYKYKKIGKGNEISDHNALIVVFNLDDTNSK